MSLRVHRCLRTVSASGFRGNVRDVVTHSAYAYEKLVTYPTVYVAFSEKAQHLNLALSLIISFAC